MIFNNLIKYIFILFLSAYHNSSSLDLEGKQLLIIVLGQPNSYHETRAAQFTAHIQQQQQDDEQSTPNVLHTTEKFDWTLFPIITRIAKDYPKTKWFMICETDTRINIVKILENLSKYDHKKPYYIGRDLHDEQPAIIHHFHPIKDVTSFIYGDTNAGLLLSRRLVRLLTSSLALKPLDPNFSIDAKHELAVYIEKQGHLLTSVDFLCSHSNAASCATSVLSRSMDCGLIDEDDLYVAIKTAKVFHKSRVQILLDTWGRDVKHIDLYSDVADASIPTIYMGVNTEKGHCGKMYSILENVYKKHLHNRKWLLIADDDTLLSVARLRRVLSCFDAITPMGLGERYGYGAGKSYGYDYLTGGSGMILSMAAVKKIIESGQCRCRSDNSPDDMHLGSCMSHLSIPITHYQGFHQAQRSQYSNIYNDDYVPISYHKHTQTDPMSVYAEYLSADVLHTEL